MFDEYNKCRYCKHYDSFDGCENMLCENKSEYLPDKNRIIKKAKEKGITVSDLICLIDM